MVEVGFLWDKIQNLEVEFFFLRREYTNIFNTNKHIIIYLMLNLIKLI